MKFAASALVAVVLICAGVYVMRPEAEQALPVPRPLAETVATLVATLESSDAGARTDAINALGQIALSLQTTSSVPAQRELQQRIGALLRDAVPALERLSTAADPAVRRDAIWALGTLRNEAAGSADKLASIVADASQPSLVRQTAIIALSRVGGAGAAPIINNALQQANDDRGIAAAAAFALGNAGAAAAAPTQPQSDDAISQRLIAAAGGGSDASVTSRGSGAQRGQYGAGYEQVIIACVELKATFDAIGALTREPGATIPTGAQSPRLAALRIAGDGTVLDATGGVIDVDAPIAACAEVQVDTVTDPTRWPLARIKYAAVQPRSGGAVVTEWRGLLDVASLRWAARYPATTSYMRSDGTQFSDELRTWLAPGRRPRLAARFAGIDMPIRVEAPPLALAHVTDTIGQFSIDAQRFIVPTAPLASAPWLSIVMYGPNWSGTRRQQPPEGVAVPAMTGAVMLPPEPAEQEQKLRYWREHLRHDHLAVRMYAASKLAQEKDRAALADMVQILTSPSDVATQVIPALASYGGEVAPHVVPLLADEREHVKSAAWSLLARVGEPALPQIRQALESPNAETRAAAIKALNGMQPPQAAKLASLLVPMLQQCAASQRVSECFALIDAVSAAGPAAAAAQPTLESLVKRETGYMQVRAAVALYSVGGRDLALAVVANAARTGRGDDADVAVRHLVMLLKADAVPILADVLRRRDDAMAQSTAALELARLGAAAAAAVPAMEEAARDRDVAVRRRVMPALAAVRTPDTLRILGVLVRDSDPNVSREAFAALRDRGVDAVPLFAPIVGQPGNPIRNDVVYHLGRLGPAAAAADPGVIPLLQRLICDEPEGLLRSNAVNALKAITAPRAP